MNHRRVGMMFNSPPTTTTTVPTATRAAETMMFRCVK